MSSNPYPDTRHLFSEGFYRRHAEPALQPDYGEHEPGKGREIEKDFRRLARALGMSPGKLLVRGMVTAIELGHASGVLQEVGE